MRKALALLLLACLFAAGCNGAKETDEIAWVVTMGIDRAADGDLLVTYRIAVPTALAGGDAGPGAGKESSTLITVKAPSLAEARNLLNTALSRSVSLTHVTAIFLGEDLARHGVQDIFAPLLRFREFRGPTFLVVIRGGKVSDAFHANKPPIDALVSRWVNNYMRNYDEVGYYLPFTLHGFYTRLKSASGAPLAVGYGINPFTAGDRNVAGQPYGKVKTYLPGDLPRQSGNPAEFAGTAVFRGARLAGFLDTGETRALAILLDKFPFGFIVVADPLLPGSQVNVAIRNGRSPRISVNTAADPPVITVDVFLEGETTGIPSGIAYEQKEYLPLLEQQVSATIHEQILNMLVRTRSWGCDVADFGYHARPNFLTTVDMRQYRWPEKFLRADFAITVNTEIRRTGLLRRTREIRKDPNP